LLEERGRLRGLVTVKDVLKYTARIESVGEASSPTSRYSRECGGVFDKFSSWINNKQSGSTTSRQPYTQLQNRSSFDVNGESHELDGRL
jgi:chloride channel 3/4/5